MTFIVLACDDSFVQSFLFFGDPFGSFCFVVVFFTKKAFLFSLSFYRHQKKFAMTTYKPTIVKMFIRSVLATVCARFASESSRQSKYTLCVACHHSQGFWIPTVSGVLIIPISCAEDR